MNLLSILADIPAAPSGRERMILLSDPESVAALHQVVWALPEERLAVDWELHMAAARGVPQPSVRVF